MWFLQIHILSKARNILRSSYNSILKGFCGMRRWRRIGRVQGKRISDLSKFRIHPQLELRAGSYAKQCACITLWYCCVMGHTSVHGSVRVAVPLPRVLAKLLTERCVLDSQAKIEERSMITYNSIRRPKAPSIYSTASWSEGGRC